MDTTDRAGAADTMDRPRFAPEWLTLRESADAAARAPELLDPLSRYMAATRTDAPLVIRDLGCGTGSMGRWLAPRLNGPQHWILHDHDPDLLALAASRLPRTAADGSSVTVSTRCGDIALLDTAALDGTSLVTASALLDLLTREELDALAAACAEARSPVLLALSVVGRVDIEPADALDAEITEAFNAHQRRLDDGRRLLGPDAVAAASVAFARYGMTVRVQPSPWRLGDSTGTGPLAAEWLRGWVGAACEQRPDLAAEAGAYLNRRLTACAAGELSVTLHHSDVLALPGTVCGGTGGGAGAGAS
ncbi:class I SAM-dependent methyltransferase [Streptomyces sp. SCSIO 30461]